MLTTLNLDENQLTKMPELNQFTNLDTLHLRQNLISSIDPSNLSPLKKLVTLFLSNNRIPHLDSWGSIHLPHLQSFHLDSNHLHRLDVLMWRLPKLKDLFVDNNQLHTIEGFESIADALKVFFSRGNP